MIYLLVLLALFFALHAVSIVAPLDWRVKGHWRPILCPAERLDYLRDRTWSSHVHQRLARVLHLLGKHQAAQLFEDLAYSRALEERLEAESYAQTVRVRAIVRVLA